MNRMLLLLLIPLTLAACGSLLQTKAAPTTMYLLSMTRQTPEGAVPALPIDLTVLKPRVRVGLDTDHIAVLFPDRRLDYFANVRWSGPLDELVQELAVQEFHVIDAVRNVSSDASAFASSYWLELEVADFQAEYSAAESAPSVHVRLLARIGSSTDRRILARFEADAREQAADNRLGAIVDAYNRAGDEALSSIVENSVAALRAR